MIRTVLSGQPAAPTALDLLRGAVGDLLPLRALDPSEYAVGHALFESRSDQRGQLTGWLVRRLAARAADSTRVLSLGCGDGSVDVRLAVALAAGGHPVDYTGVEPYRPSGEAFAARLSAVPGVRASLLAGAFAETQPEGRYDVVLAVHSLYYVDDLAASLRRACELLAPGGVLVVLHAPYAPLNTFVRYLSPGRRQPFSDEVVRQLREQGHSPAVTRLDNRLDLTETGDADTDRRLLEFTVQAQLPAAVQYALRAALTAQALPGPGLVVAHPVDAVMVDA